MINVTASGPAATSFRRVIEAREHLHRETCPRPLDKDPHGASQCVLGVPPLVVAAALDHLDERPRDAKGVRVVLHDAICTSRCTGEAAQDHADRTQSKAAAALRKFRATEGAQL